MTVFDGLRPPKTRKPSPTPRAAVPINKNSSLTSTRQSSSECQHIPKDSYDNRSKIVLPLLKSHLSTCQQIGGENGGTSHVCTECHPKKAVPTQKRKLPSCEQISEGRQVSNDNQGDRTRKVDPSPKSSCQPTRSECCSIRDREVNHRKSLHSNKRNLPSCQLSNNENGCVFRVCVEEHPKRAISRKTRSPTDSQTARECDHVSQHCFKSKRERAASLQCSVSQSCHQINDDSECENSSQNYLQNHCKRVVSSRKSKSTSCENNCSEQVHVFQGQHKNSCRKTIPSPKCHSPSCQEPNSESLNVLQVHFECSCKTPVPVENISSSCSQTNSDCDRLSKDCLQCHQTREVSPQNNISPACQQNSCECLHAHTSKECIENAEKKKSQSCQQINNDCVNVFQVHLKCKCKTSDPSQSNNSHTSSQTNSERNCFSQNINESHERPVSPQNHVSATCQQPTTEREKKHISQDCVENGCNMEDAPQTISSPSHQDSSDCISPDYLENHHENSTPIISFTSRKRQEDSESVSSSDALNLVTSQSNYLSQNSTVVNEQIPSKIDSFISTEHLRETHLESPERIETMTVCSDEESEEGTNESAELENVDVTNETCIPSEKIENMTVNCDEENEEKMNASVVLQNVNNAKEPCIPSENIENMTVNCDEENEEKTSAAADCQNINHASETCVELPKYIQNIAVNSKGENEDRMNVPDDLQNVNGASEMWVEPPENFQNIGVYNEENQRTTATTDLRNVNGASDPAFKEPPPIKEAASEGGKNSYCFKDRQLSCSEITSVSRLGEESKEITELSDEDHSHIPRKRIRIHEERESLEIDNNNVVYIPGTSEGSALNTSTWTQENGSDQHLYDSNSITKDNDNKNYFSGRDQQLSNDLDTPGTVPLITAIVSVRHDFFPSSIPK